MMMKVNEKASKLQLRRDVQRAFERKQKKGTQTEKSWAQKFICSTILDVKGMWEKRRDDRTGLVFFHKKMPLDQILIDTSGRGGSNSKHHAHAHEHFSDTCQWEVPLSFESMPVLPEEAQDFSSLASLPGDAAAQDHHHQHHHHTQAQTLQPLGGGVSQKKKTKNDDFEQPGEDWYPSLSLSSEDDDYSQHNPAPNDFSRKSKATLPKAFGGGKGPAVPSLPKKHKLFDSNNSELSAGASVGALKSEGEFTAATIDTENLEHIAEQLVTSDELITALARRLGLNTKHIVPTNELFSVFSKDDDFNDDKSSAAGSATDTGQMNKKFDKADTDSVLRAPRQEFLDTHEDPMHDSEDDLFSEDEDIIAGDVDDVENEIGENIPANCADVARYKREKYREDHGMRVRNETSKKRQEEIDKKIPFLNMMDLGISSKIAETNANILGWKRLPRPTFNVPEFLAKLSAKRTQGPDHRASNTLNYPNILSLVSPSDATLYEPEGYTADYASIFVPDADKDITRAVFAFERQQVLDEQLNGLKEATDDMLLPGYQTNELTKVDEAIRKNKQSIVEEYLDPKKIAIEKAIQAAKTNNLSIMEDSLEEGIHPDVTDQFGNSLLLLAAQQGGKQMVKFLLRRGAKINFTNNSGNTALHYLFAYKNDQLGHYLIQKVCVQSECVWLLFNALTSRCFGVFPGCQRCYSE
jgi:hypothetical protein